MSVLIGFIIGYGLGMVALVIWSDQIFDAMDYIADRKWRRRT